MKQSFLVVAMSTAAGLVLANTGFADTIRLKNGNTLEGTIEASNNQQVTINVPGAGKLTLERTEIASIEKSSSHQEAPQQPLSQSEMNRGTNVSQSSQAHSEVSSEEKYSNPTLGISVVKPADWNFITNQEMMRMRKYKEPYDDVNPTFELAVVRQGNVNASDPKANVELQMGATSTLYQDFKIVQGPENVMLKGRNAGYAAFNYSEKVPDGRTVPVRNDIWIIPRKEPFIIMISAETRQDEKTGTRDEIRSIVNSLVIEDRE